MELTEFLIELITFIIITLGIVGMVAQSASFEGDVLIYDLQRTTIDISQAAMSAPCLVQEVGGETRKGVFDYQKLNSAQSTRSLCFDVAGYDYGIEITLSDGSAGWTLGKTVLGGDVRRYPVAVYERIRNTETIVPGEMVVRVVQE